MKRQHSDHLTSDLESDAHFGLVKVLDVRHREGDLDSSVVPNWLAESHPLASQPLPPSLEVSVELTPALLGSVGLSSNTTRCPFGPTAGAPSVLTGTASNRSRTHCSNVSTPSLPITVNFILLAQYSFSHHEMSCCRGSRPSALGLDQSVS